MIRQVLLEETEELNTNYNLKSQGQKNVEEIERLVKEAGIGVTEEFIEELYNKYVKGAGFGLLDFYNGVQKASQGLAAKVLSKEPYKSDYINKFNDYSYKLLRGFLIDTNSNVATKTTFSKTAGF